jgi:hypothetical protein
VVDAFRNSTGLYTSAYLKSVDKVCSATSSKVWAIPSADNGREFRSGLTKVNTTFLAFNDSFAAVKAPKKWRAFEKAAVADNVAYAGLIHRLSAYVGPHPTTSRAIAGLTKYGAENDRLVHRINKRFDDEHLFTCGSQF